MTMTQMPPKPASQAQQSFIQDLLTKRETAGTAYEGWTPDWSKATSQTASQVITYLKTLPVKSTPAHAPTQAPSSRMATQDRWDSIPVGPNGYGYYALQTGHDETRFFRVERPKTGKWAGMTFIKEQAGDAFYPIEPKGRGYAYLTEIAEDFESAGSLYGQEIGQCYRCHRTLTDDTSRAAGIGPDCAGKV